MITLSEGVRRREDKISYDITEKIIQALVDTFEFKILKIESWKNETSPSLGGKLLNNWQFNDAHDEEQTFRGAMTQVLSNILVVKGNIKTPKPCAVEVEFNIWSPLRKLYSDVLIDTSPNERDSIIDILWTEKGKTLSIGLVKQLAKIRTEIDGRQRKTVSEILLSPEVEETDQFYAEDYIGFYSSRAKPYYLLKRMINGALKSQGAEEKIKSKLGLFNLDKFARKVYDISAVKRKFEVIDKRVAQLPIGSIFFLARDRDGFQSFAKDVSEQIVKPSLEPLESEDDIIRKIEQNIEKQGLRPLG